jgi:hypothetical protein
MAQVAVVTSCQMGNLSDDFREARRRTYVRKPIAPISEHFAHADSTYQGAQASATVAEFLRQWRVVRRERRTKRRRNAP